MIREPKGTLSRSYCAVRPPSVELLYRPPRLPAVDSSGGAAQWFSRLCSSRRTIPSSRGRTRSEWVAVCGAARRLLRTGGTAQRCGCDELLHGIAVGRQPGSKDLAIPRAHHDAAAIAGELVGEILGRPQAADPCIFGPTSPGSERPNVHGMFYRNSTAWSSDFTTLPSFGLLGPLFRGKMKKIGSRTRVVARREFRALRDGFARHSLFSAFSGPF